MLGTGWESMLEDILNRGEVEASNSWVVGPSHTKTGIPLLHPKHQYRNILTIIITITITITILRKAVSC